MFHGYPENIQMMGLQTQVAVWWLKMWTKVRRDEDLKNLENKFMRSRWSDIANGRCLDVQSKKLTRVAHTETS